MSININVTETKKLLTWKLNEEMTTLTLETPVENVEFMLGDFFKSVKWERLADVEKLAVVNGIKQKLADKTAASKELQLSVKEKLVIVKETWKRLCDDRQWNKPSEGRKAAVSKIDNALTKASEAELGMMLKLGLIDQKKHDDELDRRTKERVEE